MCAAVARYCERLAVSAAWGGHPELKALSCTLGVPIVVFQAEGEPWRVAPTADRMLGSGGGGSGSGSGSGSAWAASSLATPRSAAGQRARARDEYDGAADDDDGGGRGGARAFDDSVSDEAALRLSYHRHFSAGDHYNSVVVSARRF